MISQRVWFTPVVTPTKETTLLRLAPEAAGIRQLASLHIFSWDYTSIITMSRRSSCGITHTLRSLGQVCDPNGPHSRSQTEHPKPRRPLMLHNTDSVFTPATADTGTATSMGALALWQPHAKELWEPCSVVTCSKDNTVIKQEATRLGIEFLEHSYRT